MSALPQPQYFFHEPTTSATRSLFTVLTGGEPPREPPSVPLKDRFFLWISRNPGVDAEAAAEHFGVDPVTASQIVEELLNEGLLDFNE